MARMPLLIGLLALCWGFLASPVVSAQNIPADTVEADADTLRVDTLRTPANVQVSRGRTDGARRPSGMERVRRRIAEIRGQRPAQQRAQQSAPSQQPIIIVVTREVLAQQAETGRPLLIPGSDGRYYFFENLQDYLAEGDRAPYRLQIQPGEQVEEEPAPPEPPPAEELTDPEEPPEPAVETPLMEAPPFEPDTLAAPDVEVSEETIPMAMEPTVRQVERAILDTGLFRALGVNFEFDHSTLLPEASRTLDVVGEVLQRYPALRVEVAGHTDSAGPADYNQTLSERRAQEVVEYLVRTFDIDPERLEARGYGEEEPFATNETSMGRALNRRVEFVLLNPEAAEQYREGAQELGQEGENERLLELIRQVIREELRRQQDDS